MTTTLICLVQRLTLADGTTVVRQGETFDIDDEHATQYVGGGIAAPIGKPAEPKPEPEPVEAPPVEPAELPEPGPRPTQSGSRNGGKRGRG